MQIHHLCSISTKWLALKFMLQGEQHLWDGTGGGWQQQELSSEADFSPGHSSRIEWTEPPGSKGRWQWQQFNIVSDHVFQLQFSWAVAPCAWILSKLQILTYKLQVLNTSGSEPREFLIWPHFAQASLSLLLCYAHHPLLIKVSGLWCFVSVARTDWYSKFWRSHLSWFSVDKPPYPISLPHLL